MAIFGSLLDDVLEIVEAWQPKEKYKSEAAYRNDLIKYLRKKLNEEQGIFDFGSKKHIIRKEAGRHLADIGIDRKIGIELKFNLARKSQRNRLVGQLNDYLKGYEDIIVVLCGKIKESEYEELCENVKRIAPEDFLGEQETITVIRKDKPIGRKRSGFWF